MKEKAVIMGVPIDIVTLEGALEKAKALYNRGECTMIATPNTEIVMAATQDIELQEVLSAADLVIPDGIGLIYASKIQKLGLLERVTGVDLMKKLLGYVNSKHGAIYILGGKEGVARLATENIKTEFPFIEIAGYHDGYFDGDKEEEIINEINSKNTDILFVALGAPRQEKWIYQNRSRLKVKIAMGVGGSVDIWAGTAKRAPIAYQRLGLEWFYRLMKEPWRYKRMLALPKFMIKILLSK